MSPFDPAAVSAETAAFNAKLKAMLAELPPVHTVPVEDTRKARAEGRGPFRLGGPMEGSDWVGIDGAVPGARVRISRPDRPPRGVYLHIHGGGWTLGSPEQYDLYNQHIATETGLEVVAVEYRLAPESAWPAPAEDCLAAAHWTLARYDGPLIVGGESAGAHLAAILLVQLRDEGFANRLAGAVLTYGMYDLRLTPSARNWGEENLVLSTPIIEWFCGNLVQGRIDPRDPAISPLFADLTGLPPALFQIGTFDPLLDDSLFMAARWQAAGNRTDLAIWPGGVHGFDQFDLPMAAEAHARQDAFVNDLLR